MAQVVGMTVPFLRRNLYSEITMSPLKHLPYKSNPLSARHSFKSPTLFCYIVVVVKTFAAPSVNSLTFFYFFFYFYWFCFFWNFLPPTSPLLVPLGGVSRPVNPGSLLAPLWSFISRASTSLSLSLSSHLALSGDVTIDLQHELGCCREELRCRVRTVPQNINQFYSRDETDVAGGSISSSSSIAVSMVVSGCNNNVIKIFINQLLCTTLYLSCKTLVFAPNRLGD